MNWNFTAKHFIIYNVLQIPVTMTYQSFTEFYTKHTQLGGLHVPKYWLFVLDLYKQLFFLLLTYEEIKAFYWPKTLFSP